MQTHDLIQGSPEWHAHRATHFNASDAPAMMGCSPYETRTQLIHRLKTGISKEVDAATQKRFDDGHRFEALARPLAEKIIGEDLYPVTGSDGELSASFDGLTMAEDMGFEHKSLNADLRDVLPVKGMNEGVMLPLMYRVQMEQQCMVAACECELFMASKWERVPEFPEDDPRGWKLVEERHCWYESSQHLADDIAAGWRQLAEDLAAYVAVEVIAAPVGRTPETLPALRVEVTGAVTASNLADYKTHALEVFGGINRDLKTDQDFADAEKAVKWCGDVEDRLAAAKQHALSQTESIDTLFRTIDDISAEARRVRLELDKLVKNRKEAIRGEIVADGIKGLGEHVAGLNARLGRPLMPSIGADFGGAIKGKKSLDSMRDAVSAELASAKIEATRIADQIAANLKTLAANSEHASLFPDTAQLVLKAADDLAAVIVSRIATHKTTEEAKRQAEAAKVIVEAPAPAPAPAVIQLTPRAEPVAGAAPTLTLGQIGTRLGFALTADFLRSIGFEPAGRARAAVLFHDADFAHICAALVEHIQSIQAKQAA